MTSRGDDDVTILMCAQKLTDASLIYRTEPKNKTSKMKKTKKQTDMPVSYTHLTLPTNREV